MQIGHLSRYLIIIGISLIFMGILLRVFDKIDWIKNIPGTLHFDLGGVTCIVPIIASIILSLVMTILFNAIGRFLNR